MNPDDPKLTAYALDEIDPADRAELERLLRDDPTALAEVEETRAFAATLRHQLATEPAYPLSESQRTEVLDAARRTEAWRASRCDAVSTGPAPNAASQRDALHANPRKLVRFHCSPAVLSALAASIAVLASLAFLFPAIHRHYTAMRQPAISVGEKDGSFKLAMAPQQQLPASLEIAPVPNEETFTPEHPAISAPSVSAITSSTSAPTSFTMAAAPIPVMKATGEIKSLDLAQAPTFKSTPAELAPYPKTPVTASRGLPTTMSSRMGGTARPAGTKSIVSLSASAPAQGRSRDYYYRGDLGGGGRMKSLGDLDRLDDGTEPRQTTDTASYEALADNPFQRVSDQPLSTFSIDVDTASYANVRRFLNSNTLPPRDAVRIEELINYFHYDYPAPDGDAPFSSTMEVAACPWSPEHRLVRIGLKGREIQRADRAASNLVFLIDVSGSMQPAERLPLLKRSMSLLVDQLTDRDRVAIVVYAGASGCALESTHDKRRVRDALDALKSGGSTNGASGIQLAYELAQKHFIKGGTNRVILATDGDFNVGITDQDDLIRLIEKKAKSGVFLTCLGFGTDNLKDSTLEKLADKGNGNYSYIDTLAEGRRVLVEQMAGTLITIAKDVKIQVEFNPAKVGAYRLIGYENRLLKKEDFNDDAKDAGEIGSGHHVTALYEIVPVGKELAPSLGTDPLKYQPAAKPVPEPIREPQANASPELLTLKLRYKKPDADVSTLREFPLTDTGATREKCSRDFRFAAAVASFGMILRDSPHRGNATWNSTLELAAEGKGEDRDGYRAEFVGLVEKAKALAR